MNDQDPSPTRRAVLGGAVAAVLAPAAVAAQGGDTIVVTSPIQLNGVAEASDGRLFVSLPRWTDRDTPSVALVGADGALTPYPGGSWNNWRPGTSPTKSFVCVNALRIDPQGSRDLWIIDAGAPRLGPIVPSAPKLVRIDVDAGRVVRAYPIDATVTRARGYLNDARFAREHAFISESGEGAIIVLDLATGRARRRLSDSASTKATPGRTPVIDGQPVRQADGTIPKVNVDGIELSLDGEWLLYAVPFGGWLWRVRVTDLLDDSLSEAELARRVERMGELMPIGGMTGAPDGGLYLSDVQGHAIVHRLSDGTLRVVQRDSRLQWPDASALDGKGGLLVAASQVNRMALAHAGRDVVTYPFQVLRIPIP